MPEIIVQGYKDRCYTFGSLFVGATGGAALGYVTKIFDSKQKVDKYTVEMTNAPDTLKKNKHFSKLQKLQIGGNMYWRIGGQVLGTVIMYSFLECKFQGGYPRRSMFDCTFAGALTGGAFGLRGVPGGAAGARYGAATFAAYASIMYLLFRR